MRSSKYTREVLEPVVKGSHTLAEVIRKLGLRPTGGNHRYISLRIRRTAIDTSHFSRKKTKRIAELPPEELADLVKKCTSFAQVLKLIDLPEVGRPHADLKARVFFLGIDTTHFTGQGWARGKTWKDTDGLRRLRDKNRFTDAEVFVENSPFYRGAALLPRLLERGWPYACAWCGIASWRDLPLVLHVDHINGIHNDNRFGNLRLLCPNCHSQTATYSNRRRG